MSSGAAPQRCSVEAFEAERARLTLLAYRICGSWADAEDVVQTVAAEWLHAAAKVQNLAGWLTRVTVRRSIDALRSRERQPAYVGQWLPEPLIVDEDGPYRRLEETEALSTAFLVLAEALTPPQRAVVVLRTLGYGHAEIAEILRVSIAASRQHHSRAMRALSEVNGCDVETDPALGLKTSIGQSPQDAEVAGALLTAFLDAARRGDVEGLTLLLHEQVVAYQDGGGNAQAARRALVGPSNVARFAVGVARLHRARRGVRRVAVGGAPGAILSLSEARHVVSMQVREGRIYRLFDVCNPEKHATLGELPVAV